MKGLKSSNFRLKSAYPEQVFTRDIGFTLGNTVYVAEMATDIRQGEELILKSWLETNGVPFFNLRRNRI